jgi:PAS domain S-box-containing protein
MQTAGYKQLKKAFGSVKEITGIQMAVFSFLNESSAEFEIKIIEGISIEDIQFAKKTIQNFVKDFNPFKFAYAPHVNSYLKNIIDNKTFCRDKVAVAVANFFPKEATDAVMLLADDLEITTFPVIIDGEVKGLIGFINPPNGDEINLDGMKSFTDLMTLFIDNILINEKLIQEVKEKTISLEKEKDNLENNVRERTQKLDNSRSALLYMLKDIDKSSKKLSAAKEYTENIIRSMIETLIVIDKEGIIQTANRSTLELLGYNEKELIGQHLSFIFPGSDISAANSFIADLIEKDFISNVERIYITKGGTEIPVVFSGSVMKEEGIDVQGIVCVASDITIRKEHELEVQEQNRRIEEANEELIVALRKAEESDKLKTAFLQNMSHEIRTPLNGIVGFSQLLSSKNYPEANKIEIAKLVERSSYRLIELVNNILDIAKIETGQVKVNNCAFVLNNFMKELHDFFTIFVQEKNLKLTYANYLPNDESIIFLDREKLHQIMVNLINNAIKFTSTGGIHYGYTIKNHFLEFFIHDTGMGIPEELQEKVFERFTQADIALTRNYEGSGLGLSICKGLIELLGGKIWMTSEINKGTSFYFTMPFYPANKKKEHEDAAFIDLELIGSPIKILVAEDDEVNYKFLEYLFLNSKHKITRAENGQIAVDLVTKRDDFDIVLMDLKMPVMTGYEATKIIKSKFPDLPIIALSAYAFDEDRQKAFDAGCDDFIKKAYRRETLFETIIKFMPD